MQVGSNIGVSIRKIFGIILSETQKSYELQIRRLGRLLHKGAINRSQFESLMFTTLDVNLTWAWSEGLKEVGIDPSEQTFIEKLTMKGEIVRQQSYIPRLAEFIMRKRGEAFSTVTHRFPLWANRYLEMQNLAKQMAREDVKLMWVYDPQKDHCKDCRRLNGKVKRASYWRTSGVDPQSPGLACHGMHCGCKLVVTDAPMSKGPLPKIG
jgi:hypothetical protein